MLSFSLKIRLSLYIECSREHVIYKLTAYERYSICGSWIDCLWQQCLNVLFIGVIKGNARGHVCLENFVGEAQMGAGGRREG